MLSPHHPQVHQPLRRTITSSTAGSSGTTTADLDHHSRHYENPLLENGGDSLELELTPSQEARDELDVRRTDTNVTMPPSSLWSFLMSCCRRRTHSNSGSNPSSSSGAWKILLAGQVLSFGTASTGAAQATLTFDCHLSAPSCTIGFTYATLMATCLLYLVYQEQVQQRKAACATSHNGGGKVSSLLSTLPSPPPYRLLGVVPLQAPPLAYLPMAVLDVYANYFTILAFKYTTITSVTLLDALAIPSAMVLSVLCLHRRYGRVHLLAVACCLTGVWINVWQDVVGGHDDSSSGSSTSTLPHATKNGLTLDDVYPHRTWGDGLAICGGLLFGAANVYGEYAVQNLGGPVEYVGMLGAYGSLLCLVQTLLLEREDVAAFYQTDHGHGDDTTCTTATAQGLLVAFTLGSVVTYGGSAAFLQVSDAAFFNLSLLTGDLWSVAFSVLAEGIVPGHLFFVALVFIVSGVLLYERADAPTSTAAAVASLELAPLGTDGRHADPERDRLLSSDDPNLGLS
jgi:solute carrier family 35 protein F1/2